MGYISNPDIEANLRDAKVKQTIAEIISDAIRQYVQLEDPVMKRMATCVTNLKQLGLVLHLYSTDHQGKYPTDLTDLHFVDPPYISVPYPFACPGYVSTMHKEMTDGTKSTGYVYVGGLTARDSGDIMVIFDASPNNHAGRGRTVLCLNGHTEFYPEDLFQERLNKQRAGLISTEVKLPAAAIRSIAESQR